MVESAYAIAVYIILFIFTNGDKNVNEVQLKYVCLGYLLNSSIWLCFMSICQIKNKFVTIIHFVPNVLWEMYLHDDMKSAFLITYKLNYNHLENKAKRRKLKGTPSFGIVCIFN